MGGEWYLTLLAIHLTEMFFIKPKFLGHIHWKKVDFSWEATLQITLQQDTDSWWIIHSYEL